jgi:hypothetical protein
MSSMRLAFDATFVFWSLGFGGLVAVARAVLGWAMSSS